MGKHYPQPLHKLDATKNYLKIKIFQMLNIFLPTELVYL